MREEFPRIDSLGAALVAVVCQRPDRVDSWLSRNPHPFPVVVDESRSLARAWGVHQLLGYDAFNIARPSSFVVDGRGIVRFAFVAPSQWRPADTASLLSALEQAVRGR